jgi:hypothetical protein
MFFILNARHSEAQKSGWPNWSKIRQWAVFPQITIASHKFRATFFSTVKGMH